jgi:uncharacterized protein (DUF362 family)
MDGSKRKLNRREFLHLLATVGGITALAPILEACERAGLDTQLAPSSTSQPRKTYTPKQPSDTASPPDTLEAPTLEASESTATETPAPTEIAGSSKVVLVKTTDRMIGAQTAIQLLDIESLAGKRIFVKPNFNSADPTPGSTHPDVLRVLIQALQRMGAATITLGDRSGMGNTRSVMQQLGVFDLADELGFEAIVFDDLDSQNWEVIQPLGSHWEQGFAFARLCLEADALVQTCCLKTHRFGGVFSMSLKNSVGLVAGRHPVSGYNYMGELHNSANQRRMIAEINTAYQPAMILLDGMEAFISGGPDVGQKVSSGVMLAGTDRIAIDAVGVAILRFFGANLQGGIFEQEQIARAVELGLGVDSPEKIEFITADEPSMEFAMQIKEVLDKG